MALVVNIYVLADGFTGRLAEEILERLTTAGSIVAGCGTMAMLVLMTLGRRGEIDRRTAAVLSMTVVCPRCRRKHQAPIGSSACPGCGLKIRIGVEEPRCPSCDYLLYKLTSDRCPECGTPSIERRPAPFATMKSVSDSAPPCGQGACSSCAFGE